MAPADWGALLEQIPTMFSRGADGRVIPSLTNGCEWVINNGLMTILIDGKLTKVTNENGTLHLYRAERNQFGNILWVRCDRSRPDDLPLFKAMDLDGTGYEGFYISFGQEIKGNRQACEDYRMLKLMPIAHGLIVPSTELPELKRGSSVTVGQFYESLKYELSASTVKGLVFHWEDPACNPKKLAKIERTDFGLPWPCEQPKLD